MEIKPCPFCGGEAVIERLKGNKLSVFVCCKDEDCYGCGPIEDTKEEAIEKWNRRTPPTERPNR